MTLLHVVEWLAEDRPLASTHFSVAEFRRHLVDGVEQRLRAQPAALSIQTRPGPVLTIRGVPHA